MNYNKSIFQLFDVIENFTRPAPTKLLLAAKTSEN